MMNTMPAPLTRHDLGQPTEIDHHTMKFVVGVIALTLPCLVKWFAPRTLESISDAYHAGGLSLVILVGFLFAIASFLLAYNGRSRRQMIAAKLGAVAALGVALFPCRCGDNVEWIRGAHAVSATVLFGVIAYFCFGFYRRASTKGYVQAKARAAIHAACAAAIVLSMAAVALQRGLGLAADWKGLTLTAESTALIAFGISWLLASRVLPGITRADERHSLTGARAPD
jgi:hypothetical protein